MWLFTRGYVKISILWSCKARNGTNHLEGPREIHGEIPFFFRLTEVPFMNAATRKIRKTSYDCVAYVYTQCYLNEMSFIFCIN